ncbi:MAG: DUF1295 domain-containing protein [Muribaculaceae bacterium]
MINDISTFNSFLAIMALIAVVVFVALHYVKAGYGMMYTRRWGPTISNRIGWIIMEAPVFVAMLAMWWLSGRRTELVPTLMLIIFEIHYFQRSFVFPLLLRGNGRMPLSIIVMSILFNLLNAAMQGGWIFYFAPADMYSPQWLTTPQFIIGTMVFFAGMAINIHSDHIIRNLRAPGDNSHYIPRGGMFRYVSSANYLGEFVEWTGFAILTWSAAGAVFALWTFANLAPRARKINERYAREFGDEFKRLNLKSIIPFIY